MDARTGATTRQGRLFPKLRLPRYATKDELCARGRYASIPLPVLARVDITAAAKVTYGALLDHLRGAALWVYPSIARLAAMTGLVDRSVRRCLAMLESVSLIDCRRQSGRVSAYGFAPLEGDAGEWNEGKLPTVYEGNTPDKLSGDPGQNVRTPRTECPKTPDKMSYVNTHCKETLLRTSARNLSSRQEEIQNQLNAAHREVFGHDPPSTWAATLARECQYGDRAALAQIDAKAIRGGLALAQETGGTFGLGWVIRWLHNKAAAQVLADGHRQLQAHAQEQVRTWEAEAEASAKAELAKRRAYFATLPADRQEYYRELANRGGRVKRADLREVSALVLAWHDKETLCEQC